MDKTDIDTDKTFQVDAILVVQGAEYQAVSKAIKKVKISVRSDKIPKIIPIPIGEKDVAKILENKQCLFSSPQQKILIIGLCGSLSPQHKIGDLVLYQACVKDNESFATDQEFTAMLQQQLTQDIPLVTALTSDRIICSATKKQSLAKVYSATVVDMEGFGYLQALQSQGVSVAILRIVSDDIHYDLPDLNNAVDQDGHLQAIPMAIAMIKQPFAAFRLIRGSLKSLRILEQTSKKLFE